MKLTVIALSLALCALSACGPDKKTLCRPEKPTACDTEESMRQCEQKYDECFGRVVVLESCPVQYACQ